MNRFLPSLLFALPLASSFVLAGCGAASTDSSTGLPSGSAAGQGAGAGILTAGAWDDNRNFASFQELLAQKASLDVPLPSEGRASARDLFAGARPARQTLDVAIVIDTTGSMGDEISYVQAEFKTLAASIEARFPDSLQRWALVAYKDDGDEYVVRKFDFTSDRSLFQTKLGELSPGGGGDFPEAPDQALAAANQLAWRTGDADARLEFWIADAPYHDGKQSAIAAAIAGARSQGIHVYPIAASGIDARTEVVMRSAAQYTGGRYLFLTDDSGVGGSHLEPSVPCYFVTKLDKAVTRMVSIELSGKYEEPATADVIRTGGDPKNGSCALGGKTVSVF